MPFQLTVSEDGWHADVFRRGEAYLVIINFGYNSETKTTYSVMTGLEPLQGGDMEHFFCIISNDAENQKETYFSGAQTVDLFPKSTRKLVLDMILGTTKTLLDTAKCQSIRHSTHDADLPHKALVKHALIVKVIETCGYEIRKPDPYHGRHIWWAERLSSGAVG
jgi:hypothetical protein